MSYPGKSVFLSKFLLLLYLGFIQQMYFCV
jgi:hypothetical protein